MTPKPPETDVEDTDSIDLEGLVGGILDERGFTAERSSRLDLLEGLETRMLDAFKAAGGTGSPAAPQSAATFDEAGFIAKIETLIDGKLSANGGNNPPAPSSAKSGGGWLSRWLGL